MPIDASVRAERIWAKIERWPSSIVFTKPRVVAANGTVTPETQLAAQTVRVTADSRATVVGGSAGVAPQHALVVFGIKGHPTLPDSNIDEGYSFVWDGLTYRVNRVIPVPGGIQAICTTG